MSDNRIETVDLATEGSLNDSLFTVGHDGKVRITIDLKTGGLILNEDFTKEQNAQLFWQAVRDFVHPMQGRTIPLEPPEILKLKVDLPVDRVETGSVQFNEDWPGVFIRGDNAGWYGFNLGELLDNPEAFKDDEIGKALLRGLVKILNGCQV